MDFDRLVCFWVVALGYEFAPLFAGFVTWNDYYCDVGVLEEEFVDGVDWISDFYGCRFSIWFYVVSEVKVVKNRLHLDIYASGEWVDLIEICKR